MTDEEKKEIYSVAVFPQSDLRDKMAGTPPDKDFSNAKPANQVSANTFQAYIEPFVRPLMEEDIAWLKEKVCTTTDINVHRLILTISRVIALLRLSCLRVGRNTTRISGLRKMAH